MGVIGGIGAALGVWENIKDVANPINILAAALAFFCEKMDTFLVMLTTDLTTYGDGRIWDKVVIVSDSLVVVGLTLANIFVWVELIESTTKWAEMRKASILLTFIVEIVIVNAVIYKSRDILITVYSIVQGITRGVMKNTGMMLEDGHTIFNIQISEEFKDAVGGMSLQQGIWLYIVIAIIAAWVCISTIAVLLTVFVRIFNLYILIALSPLAFACAMSKKTRFVFENFLRTFAAVAVEAIVLVVVLYLFSEFFHSGININMAGTDGLSTDPVGVLSTILTGTYITDLINNNKLNVTAVMEYLITMAFMFSVLLGMVKGSENLVKKVFGL